MTILRWIVDNEVKANPNKFKLLLSDDNMMHCIHIENELIPNCKSQKLLGMKIDSLFSFNTHVSEICSKVASKLHALSRISHFMSFSQRKLILNAFILSQFSYCPLVWMFHSRTLNNRINHLHERALRIAYQDSSSSFEDLLCKDGSFTIHHRNIQRLAIEMYKVYYGISNELMKLVFPINNSKSYPRSNEFITRRVITEAHGKQTLGFLGPKIWDLVPDEFKSFSLSKFKAKVRKWKPNACPCRLCETYIKGLGFVKISS